MQSVIPIGPIGPELDPSNGALGRRGNMYLAQGADYGDRLRETLRSVAGLPTPSACRRSPLAVKPYLRTSLA